MMYFPLVEVITPDYRYWNPLTKEPCATYAAAQDEIAKYLAHKRDGTGGFRKGPPAETKITNR